MVADVGGVAGADGEQVLRHVQGVRVLTVACGEGGWMLATRPRRQERLAGIAMVNNIGVILHTNEHCSHIPVIAREDMFKHRHFEALALAQLKAQLKL